MMNPDFHYHLSGLGGATAPIKTAANGDLTLGNAPYLYNPPAQMHADAKRNFWSSQATGWLDENPGLTLGAALLLAGLGWYGWKALKKRR